MAEAEKENDQPGYAQLTSYAFGSIVKDLWKGSVKRVKRLHDKRPQNFLLNLKKKTRPVVNEHQNVNAEKPGLIIWKVLSHPMAGR